MISMMVWNFEAGVLDICWKLLVIILIIVTFRGYKK